MIRNYLLTSYRSLLRNKMTSLINIAGLALAMASALLIYLYVTDELAYDLHHTKSDRIYRVTRNFLNADGVPNLQLSAVAPPVGPLLKNDFGEIEIMARTLQYNVVMAIEENGARTKMASEDHVFLAEPELFDIFDIDVVSGDPTRSLSRPLTMMLSETAAQKYFGGTEVIGKHLKAANQMDLEVTGVFRNFPQQSHWHPDFLVSFVTLNDSTIYGRRGLETNWGNNSFSTYLLLASGSDPAILESRLPDFLNRHFGPYVINNFGAPPDFVASKRTTLFLQKVIDIHLLSHLDDELEVGGNMNNVYMMSVIGLFIVLIACFNFVNLSTAQATKRAKEVGLRKVVGAFRRQLITQYLSESMLVSFLALVLALLLSIATLPWMNAFTGKALALDLLSNGPLLAGVFALALAVGLMAGIYPAFVISSFKPALILKGQQGSAKGKGAIRKTLVVAQFSISIILLIATGVTTQQLDFLNSRELGFDKDQMITLPLYREISGSYDAFYNELMANASIKNAGRSSRLPTGRLLDSQGARVMKGDSLVSTGVTLKFVTTDHEFFSTYSIGMAAGRPFSKAIRSDDSLAFIINEAAVRSIGWASNEEAIGKDFSYGGSRGKLIGVVKDFHFESLHEEIVPMVFFLSDGNYRNLTVKIAGSNMKQGIEHIEKTWKAFLPDRPFDYQFTNDQYSRLYMAEQKQGKLFTVFSGLAIFIASLGLFGLATFNTLQRVKEIGVRKVMGASVPGILALLSREIVVLILLANLIAWPLAWYFMNQWLESFAYHIDMGLLVYVTSALAAVGIALVTVSTQTFRAALTNPATTLRYE
ncbi:MAG: FtsX-like permease family protein [Cytophagales bacterium]|nr:FtsX-like permease family protein [Cytophagales bacterium]